MKRSFLSVFFVCAFVVSLTAQSSSFYTLLQDDTLLRNNLLEQTIKKKELAIANIDKTYAKDYKEIYDEQFSEISSLWKSTRPVTAPEVNDYLQAILKKIIDANKELKGSDARVVFTRDWWPNAVSMGDGSIAINAGLVVLMDNEAELVFVICHELSHYYLEHTQKAIKKYVEAINSESYQAELKRLSKQKYGVNSELDRLAKATIFNGRRHSRDNEAAADKQAFLFMKNTGYDCHAIISTLELLDRVDDSTFYKKIQPELVFNSPDYPFKKKWIQKESSIFSQVADNSSLTQKEKDSLKTHPDCKKRIALLTDTIRSLAASGKNFIVNESLFKKLKNDLFMEITEECYREEMLSRNLYYNLVLLQEGDDNQFAIYSIARCLNLLYEKQKLHKFGTAVDTETKGFPEDYNLLLRMLSRLRLEELATITYQFCKQHEVAMEGNNIFKKELIKSQQHQTQ